MKELLKQHLLQLPYSKQAGGGKFVIVRCPICGDSQIHYDSSHMYIYLGNEEEITWCYCHLCHIYMVVDSNFLMNELGIFDIDLGIKLNNFNKKAMALSINNKFNDKSIYYLNNYIEDCELSRLKLNYINNRIGSSFNYDDLKKLKITLNLYDLFKVNTIKELTRDERIVEALNRNFIGFISKDNAFLTMRKVSKAQLHDSINKRYVNYSIYGKFNNNERFYVIPTNIDLNNYNRIRINIAEGAFDILSIYHNLNQNRPHTINSAICGSGYLNMIKYFLLTMKLYNSEFHIYKDNDQDDKLMYLIANLLSPYNIPLYIHNNISPNEKDYGVTIDRIKDNIIRLI